MKIKTIVWREQDIHHILRHQISPDEVEEVCSDKSVIRKVDREIMSPVLCIWPNSKWTLYYCDINAFSKWYSTCCYSTGYE